ncbi:hypothetical protein A3K72_00685 [Candidatus Woesearchaeota archaeon RBG_13_36_6]|nr:MAG: hypothetical protein A3K72_00685 [Candidatus Woesearchaeota archaeon RBG_13_36_6]
MPNLLIILLAWPFNPPFLPHRIAVLSKEIACQKVNILTWQTKARSVCLICVKGKQLVEDIVICITINWSGQVA